MIFIVRIVFIPLDQKNKLESHKKVCENFCKILIHSEDTKILEFNKKNKATFIINVGLECLIEKIDVRKNNLEN